MSKFSLTKRARRNRRKLKMQVEDKTVCILVPCDDNVKTEFAFSLVEMVRHTLMQPENLAGISVQAFGSTILPFSRQQLAMHALEQKATHTLWIDSDMKFPKDMLLRFLRRDEPIIGINAMSRRAPFRNTAQSAPGVPLSTTLHSSGLEKVHRMGFGVMWVATDVFRQMETPYFNFEYVAEQGVWRGEDFDFFENARALGYEFYVDHDLSKEVMHMGSFGYNPVMMEQILEAQT